MAFCWLSTTKRSLNSHQTLFLKRGWGLGTRLAMLCVLVMVMSCLPQSQKGKEYLLALKKKRQKHAYLTNTWRFSAQFMMFNMSHSASASHSFWISWDLVSWWFNERPFWLPMTSLAFLKNSIAISLCSNSGPVVLSQNFGSNTRIGPGTCRPKLAKLIPPLPPCSKWSACVCWVHEYYRGVW